MQEKPTWLKKVRSDILTQAHLYFYAPIRNKKQQYKRSYPLSICFDSHSQERVILQNRRAPIVVGRLDSRFLIALFALDSPTTNRHRALDEAADADLREDGNGGREGGVGAGSSGFGSVEGAMVGINSVHVALSSVSAIQVGDFTKTVTPRLYFVDFALRNGFGCGCTQC